MTSVCPFSIATAALGALLAFLSSLDQLDLLPDPLRRVSTPSQLLAVSSGTAAVRNASPVSDGVECALAKPFFVDQTSISGIPPYRAVILGAAQVPRGPELVAVGVFCGADGKALCGVVPGTVETLLRCKVGPRPKRAKGT
ncbi:hypothetical protein OPT61_g2144 [Boeremia exigua]|uniref:Uncharacterized protein n=1 Tax=Boeremia exigua TaxID=749465 RepID=A0ACC2IMU9_9PLEO|nr:hypothetical protein OPT61_g2144 [Boeremia exigua]